MINIAFYVTKFNNSVGGKSKVINDLLDAHGVPYTIVKNVSITLDDKPIKGASVDSIK